MNTCRRVAANRIFFVGTKTILVNWVVNFDSQGYVADSYCLTEELCSTEWFSGLIVVSPFPPVREEGETFTSFYERYSVASVGKGASCRAYAVSGFDVYHMEFTEESRIFRL